MAECIECGEYTKFNGGLCYSCFKLENKKNNSQSSEKNVVQESFNDGLNDKDWNYRYNMIKGRIAETLIQELFLSLGYNVLGMEWKIQFQG